jgi:hypothetical protein
MKEVGSILVQYQDRYHTKKLVQITEEHGNIYINSKQMPHGLNVEQSIRWVLNIPSELYIIVTEFNTTPKCAQFTKSKFLQSFWEDYASAKTIVVASILLSKMDYDSGYDSL